MAKVLYHQDPQPVILELVDHEIKDPKDDAKVIRKTKALADAAGNVVVTDPVLGTGFGQFTYEGETLEQTEKRLKAEDGKSADAKRKAAEEAEAQAAAERKAAEEAASKAKK